MTVWHLVRACRRPAISIVLGALVACSLLGFRWSAPPVVSAEVTVTLVSSSVATDLRNPQHGLIVLAALVSARIAERLPPQTSSDTVSLAGEGVRHQWSVTVPNTGGQWVRRQERPDLRVQAIGSSEAEVASELSVALRRIDEEVATLQAPFAVASMATARAQPLPPGPVMRHGHGSRSRAAVAALLLGATAAGATAAALDRARRRRGSGPAGRGASPVVVADRLGRASAPPPSNRVSATF